MTELVMYGCFWTECAGWEVWEAWDGWGEWILMSGDLGFRSGAACSGFRHLACCVSYHRVKNIDLNLRMSRAI